MWALRTFALAVSAALHVAVVAVLLVVSMRTIESGGSTPLGTPVEVSLESSPEGGGGAASPPLRQLAEAPSAPFAQEAGPLDSQTLHDAPANDAPESKPPGMAESRPPDPTDPQPTGPPSITEAQPRDARQADPTPMAEARPNDTPAQRAREATPPALGQRKPAEIPAAPDAPPSQLAESRPRVIGSAPETDQPAEVAQEPPRLAPPEASSSQQAVAQPPPKPSIPPRQTLPKRVAQRSPTAKSVEPPHKAPNAPKPLLKTRGKQPTTPQIEAARRSEVADREDRKARRQERARRRAEARAAARGAGRERASDASGFRATRTEGGQENEGDRGLPTGRHRAREGGGTSGPGAKQACANGARAQIHAPNGARPKPFKVKVTISSSGALVSAQRLGSSGSPDADQAALSAVQNAAPFPPCNGVSGSVAFVIPFN